MIQPDIIQRTGIDAQLYRTDKEVGPVGMPMNEVYTNATRPTYFMNNISGANGKPNFSRMNEYAYLVGNKIKTFGLKEGEMVRLLDMSSVKTYDWLMERLTAEEKKSFVISFPIKNGAVARFSSGNTKKDDDVALAAICRILTKEQVADGYTSATQYDKSGERSFHSEVGLCPFAFPKYQVIAFKRAKVAEKEERKKRPRTNNTLVSPGRTFRRLNLTGSPSEQRLKHPSRNNTVNNTRTDVVAALNFSGAGHRRTRRGRRRGRKTLRW